MPDDDLIQQALSSIEADVRDGFREMLEPIAFARDLNGSGLSEEEVFATSQQLVVVPWVYRCAHVGDFLGVPPTYIELELRGVTFIQAASRDPKDWAYFRYIDYIGALHQIGVSTTSRPALTADEYAVWAEHRD